MGWRVGFGRPAAGGGTAGHIIQTGGGRI